MSDEQVHECEKCGEGTIHRNEESGDWACDNCGESYGSGAEPDLNPVVEGEIHVDDKMKAAAKAAILETVPDIVEAILASTPVDDRLEIDKLADSVESAHDRETAQMIRNRLEVGQSKNVALLNAYKSKGIDLTPEVYDLPWHKRVINEIDAATNQEVEREIKNQCSFFLGGGRTFSASEFRQYFTKLVEDQDMDHVLAYEKTCEHFKVDPGEKKFRGRHAAALSEMPEKAKGGYLKGRAEAQGLAQQRLLAEERGIEGGRLLKEAKGGSLTDAGSEGGLGSDYSDADLDAIEK